MGRATLFEKDEDYEAFERVLEQAWRREATRILAYSVMPNHWHMVIWPRRDGELSEFMRWLTVTHTQRWHANRHTAGTGPPYQGRFKSHPIQHDRHLLSVPVRRAECPASTNCPASRGLALEQPVAAEAGHPGADLPVAD